ncbi:unnamed protein product [Chrysoparadoxa australica]
MRVIAVTFALCCLAGAHAFTLGPAAVGVRAARSWSPMRMSDTETPTVTPPTVTPPKAVSTPPKEPAKAAIVQATTENVEFSAGVVGGLAGFLVGGPFLGAILAGITNYSSKQENEVGVAVRGVSTAALEVYNFLANFSAKYDLGSKTADVVDDTLTKIKKSGDADTIEKVETTLKTTFSKAKELSNEYDLVAKGKQALGVAAELSDTAIEKTKELEKEYKVTDKVKESLSKAIDSAKK